MPFITYEVEVTTDASGNATEYIDEIVGGVIYAVLVIDADYDHLWECEVVTEHGRIGVWAQGPFTTPLTTHRLPRAIGHDNAGAEIEWATGVPLRCDIPVADERVEINITSGGNTKSGTWRVIVSENDYQD